MKLKKILFTGTPIALHKGIALLRIIVGLLLLYHGLEVFKGSLMKEYAAWEPFENDYGVFLVYLGKSSEFLTGILLVLGLWTRIAAILLMGTLGYITFILGNGRFWYEEQHPFLFVLFGLLFFLTGPGSWSVDGVLSPAKKTVDGQ
jgi:putative oxidoreductase